MFRRWQRQFPFQVDLVTVHLPGRGCRISEPFATEFGTLVRTLADLIVEEVQAAPGIRAPFAFYGHSMGAGISFELARELRRQHGIEPAHLFVSGRRAPQWPHEDAGLHNLSHDEFVATVRRMNGTPKGLLESPEWTEVFLPLLRADFALIETYKYSPERPLSCAITAYCGTEDHATSLGSVCAWKEQTTSNFTLRKVSGDHFFIHSPGFPQLLARDLLALLQTQERTKLTHP